MPDDVKDCCGAPHGAVCPWDCPATPLWAETNQAVRIESAAIIIWAIQTLPVHIIADPYMGLTIDRHDASWTIHRRCCPDCDDCCDC